MLQIGKILILGSNDRANKIYIYLKSVGYSVDLSTLGPSFQLVLGIQNNGVGQDFKDYESYNIGRHFKNNSCGKTKITPLWIYHLSRRAGSRVSWLFSNELVANK